MSQPQKKVDPLANVYRISSGCTNCEACLPVCPTRSISFGARHFVIDSDTCHGCAICVKVCPVNVIEPAVPIEEEEEEENEEELI